MEGKGLAFCGVLISDSSRLQEEFQSNAHTGGPDYIGHNTKPKVTNLVKRMKGRKECVCVFCVCGGVGGVGRGGEEERRGGE